MYSTFKVKNKINRLQVYLVIFGNINNKDTLYIKTNCIVYNFVFLNFKHVTTLVTSATKIILSSDTIQITILDKSNLSQTSIIIQVILWSHFTSDITYSLSTISLRWVIAPTFTGFIIVYKCFGGDTCSTTVLCFLQVLVNYLHITVGP